MDARLTIDYKVMLIKRRGVIEATPHRAFLPVMVTRFVEKMVSGVGGMAHGRVRVQLARRKGREERLRCVI